MMMMMITLTKYQIFIWYICLLVFIPTTTTMPMIIDDDDDGKDDDDNDDDDDDACCWLNSCPQITNPLLCGRAGLSPSSPTS